MMKILMIGDVVGSPGRLMLARVATQWRQAGKADFIVANAENAAAGRGLTPSLAEELLATGVDVLTTGDHVWDQKELAPFLSRESRLVRPANFAPVCPGRGWVTCQTPVGKLTVMQLQGRTFMGVPCDCPFRAADVILQRGRDELGAMIVVDFHAEATSEKIAMGWHLDGRVSAVAGTHTHVPTADETVLPKGTAYITDLGFTGPHRSVIGRTIEPVLQKFMTGMPSKFEVATDDVRLNGLLVTVDEKSGRALSVKRVQEKMS